MTSANVTYYTVVHKKTRQEWAYSQHAYCKNTINAKLRSHVPAEDFHLIVEWPDEEEEIQVLYQGDLKNYLK